MPYIDPSRAARFVYLVEQIGYAQILTEGDLNYLMSELAAQYLRTHTLRYATLNAISGAYTESLAEFRRRVVGPYEATKIAQGVDPWAEWEVPDPEPESCA